MPISTDDTYTQVAVGDRRDRNPNQYNPLGAELARQLGVEYIPEIHNIGMDAQSLVNSPESLAKYNEMLKLYEKRHEQRGDERRRDAIKTMAALAAIAVTAGAASGAFSGGAATGGAATGGGLTMNTVPLMSAPAAGGGIAIPAAVGGSVAAPGAAAIGAGGSAVLGTTIGAGGTAAAAGGGLAAATVPTMAAPASSGIAVSSVAAPAAAAPTVTAGGAAGGMFANMSTSQWLKMGLSAASSAYSAYEENKAKKEQAEFMQKEARRMQQWEADRINRIRTGPLSKIAPFIMQDALNIYGGRGSRMDINTVMNMMGVADLSGMTPFTGFGGGQQASIPSGNNAAAKAMGA